jgi:hypothetical protein
MKELKTNPVLEKINNYKEKWIQHVRRMDRSRLPRATWTTNHQGKETRDAHWKDYWICENEVGTGHEAKIPESIMMMMKKWNNCGSNYRVYHLNLNPTTVTYYDTTIKSEASPPPRNGDF